ADMQTHRTWVDTERNRRIWLRLLVEDDRGGHDEALMSAPAHAELEEAQPVGEGADVYPFAKDEGEEARRAFEARWQCIGKPRVAYRFHQWAVRESPCDCKRCRLVRRHPGRKRAHATDQKPGIEG